MSCIGLSQYWWFNVVYDLCSCISHVFSLWHSFDFRDTDTQIHTQCYTDSCDCATHRSYLRRQTICICFCVSVCMCVAACESVRVCIYTCTRFTYGWSIAGDSPHTIAVCVNLKLLAVLFRWWKWVVKFSCCRPVPNISWYVTFLDDLSQSTFRFKKKSIRLLSSTVLGGWCTSLNQRTWTQNAHRGKIHSSTSNTQPLARIHAQSSVESAK